MYSPTVYQSNHSHNNAGGASTSTLTTRPPPSPSRQTYFQPSTPPNPAAARGRHRKLQELQHLDKEIQLLQEELKSLDKIPNASKACSELVQFIENCPDKLLPNSDGTPPDMWPYDQPVKVSRCCWKF